MGFLRIRKRDWVISLSIILVVLLAELWWHHIPLLERIDPSAYYYLLMSTASQEVDKGNLRDAEHLLRAAIEKFPDSSYAYESLADLLAREGNRSGALVNYELAIQHLGKGFTNLLTATQQLAQRPFIESKMRKLRQ